MKEKLLKWDEILKPGTPFYPISYFPKSKEVKCPVCKGKGEVELNDKFYECPECWGKGHKLETEPSEWHVIDNWNTDYWVVTRVDVSQSEGKELDKYKVMYWYQGNGFRAENVFTSKNLATRACKKRNSELAKK